MDEKNVDYIEKEIVIKDKKMSDKDIIEMMHDDLKEASEGKKDFENMIAESLDLIKGLGFPIEKGRSKVVVMDALRQTRWALSQVSNPFTTEAKPITVKPTNKNNAEQAENASEWLNYVLQNKMNWKKLVKRNVKQYIDEGAAIAKVVWKSTTKETYEETITIESEDLLGFESTLEDEGRTILKENDNEDGTIDIDIGKIYVIDESFDAEQVPFENFYPDPSASVITPKNYDCDYVIERRVMSLSQLEDAAESKGWKNIDKVKQKYKILGNKDEKTDLINEFGFDDNYLKQYRETMLPGKDEDVARNKRRGKVNVFIEYGLLDIQGDGDVVMCETVFCGDNILYCEQSSYPDESIPFIFCAFDQELFSIYGVPFVKYMEDGMRVRTALMRGYIDHVAYSNYGISLVKSGTFGETQMKRLTEKEIGSVIEVNGDPNAVHKELTPGALPGQHYALYEMWANEQEHATGFQRLGQGQSSKYSTGTASGISMTIQAGQQRANDIITDIAEGMFEEIASQGLLLASQYLSRERFQSVIGNKPMDISSSDLDPNVNVSIAINLTGQNDVRIQQIIQILSQTTVLVEKGIANPLVLKKMFQKLLNAYNFKDIEYMMDQINETMPMGSKSVYDLVRGVDSDMTDEEAMQLAEEAAKDLFDKFNQLNEQVQAAKQEAGIEEKIEDTAKSIEDEQNADRDAYNKGQANRKKAADGQEYVPPTELSPVENSQKRTAQEVSRPNG